MNNQKRNKLCKFFLNGHCKKGENCDFIHDVNQNNDKKTFKERHRRRHVKNTETFNYAK